MEKQKLYMVESLRNLILILLLTIVASAGLGQKRSAHFSMPTAAEQKIGGRDHQCIHRNKYSISQRLKFYPFNVATQIRIVYFSDPETFENRLPLNHDTVDYTKLIEVKTLITDQVNELTDVLYNIGERAPNRFLDPGGKCYNPHNAILFVNQKGHTFAFIEICFECKGHRESSRKIKLGEFCETKYHLIANYFGSVGIKTGVVDNIQ